MVQQDASAQGQHQRDRMVGDFGGAVIGDVADQDVAPRQRLAVELVVADPHAHDAAQLRKALEIGRGDRPAHDHQPIRRSAIGRVELGKARFCGADQPRIGPEDFVLEGEIGDLAILGVQHGHGHRRLLVERGSLARLPRCGVIRQISTT